MSLPVATQLSFKEQLAKYKQLIDEDIASYSEKVAGQTADTYGSVASEVADAYFGILNRGGKRIRGALTMVGYEMLGGTDKAVILNAARAVEMMHAYILVIDDIQDRAALRRGGPTAQYLLQTTHQQHGWRGDSAHIGVSLALNASLLGSHGANIILGTLDVDPELRLKAINIMNHTMTVTAHGQTYDIVNEIAESVTNQDIENVLQWKTAHYTVLNPIHMGMVLAGAPCEDTNAITEYALNLGKAFQLTDDMLIVSSDDNGKNASDDIREGKQTLVTMYALNNSDERDFLQSCLGNQDVTDKDFEKCRQIIIDSGAIDYTQKITEQYVDTARKALHLHADRWVPSSVQFLDDLADYILNR